MNSTMEAITKSCTVSIVRPIIRPIIRLRRGRRYSQVLCRLGSLYSAESCVALVEDSVDALQESVSQNIEGLVSARLDAAVHHSVTGICEGQVLLVEIEELVSDCKRDGGKLIRGRG